MSDTDTAAQDAYPCVGDTYLGWGTDADGALTVKAECDGGIRGDCGWKQDLADGLGMTDPEWQHLKAMHMQHRRELHDAALGTFQ